MKRVKLLVLGMLLSAQSCVSQTEKINGVSFVASREPIDASHVTPILDIHANYAAVMPFGFIKDVAHPEIIFNAQRQWFGETSAGAAQYIESLQKEKIKIMLKPQIWVRRGVFTGLIEMADETDWSAMETSYSKFVLEYAALAEKMKVDIFCIGTELETFVANRPGYWKNLIIEVKKVYKGKLTYAANWNEYENTPFWEALDYIGIDAYFPISPSKTPTVEACLMGWKSHKQSIYKISKTHDKPILFTEFGYRSVDYAGKEPWKSDRDMTEVNLEAQTNATQALFETFWDEDWFAGGFVWKWHHNHPAVGGVNNDRFTPQNKPAEVLIKERYSKK